MGFFGVERTLPSPARVTFSVRV